MKDLAESVEELHIVVFKNSQEKKISQDNLTVYASPHNGRIRSLLWGYALGKRICQDKGINVVTAQDPFWLGMVGRSISEKCNAGLEIQLHGDFFSNPYWRKESFLNKFIYRMGLANVRAADSVRVVSPRIKNDLLKRGISAEKIIVIPVFVPWQELQQKEPRFSLKEKYLQFDFIVLSLGRIEWVKHLDQLIRAWAEFIKENKNAGLIIVGNGQEKNNLIKLVKDLNIEKNVIFEDQTDDVVSYYKGADCFVLTSYYEGWGRTVVEAMACGCPVIMTDVGCAGELVKEGETGLVVAVDDEEHLLNTLKVMHDNPAKRDQLALEAKNILEQLPRREETRKLYLQSWERATRK